MTHLRSSLVFGLLAAAAISHPSPAQAAHPANLGLYHTYDEMLADLQGLQAAHPGRAQLISIGEGWEVVGEFDRKRQIWALKISDNVREDEGEPEVVFVGAHHAREWISVEVPLALAHHLLGNYSSDPSIQEIVDNKVVWIIPMLNPDGHVHSATVNRCWRKNRRNNGDGTFGVDPNRNYGYQWATGGSSGTTSSDIYHGPAPFSEPETLALRDFLRARSNLRAAVSFHNYTQAVLRPWSHTLNFTPGDPPPPGELMLKDISDRLREVILGVHGQTYKDCLFQVDRLPSGGCPSPHYAASGEFTDWVYHEFNIPAYTIEVRPQFASDWPANHSCPGFELPEAQIQPTVEENIQSALTLIHYAQPGDIMIRDHASDDGSVPSSTLTPSGWDPVFWLSPDIWSDPPAPVRGETATITARVRNLTGSPVHDVTVQVYFSDPSINLEFPNPDATLLGEGTIPPIPPNGTREFDVQWNVPSMPNAVGDHHWCVGVVIKHPDDLPLSTQAIYSNNVAYRNFAPVATSRSANALRFLAQNSSSIRSKLDIFVATKELPAGWQVVLDPDRPETLGPGERYLGFAEVTVPDGAKAGEGLVEIHGALTPRRPGTLRPVGSGVTFRVTYTPPKRFRPERLALLRSHEDLLKGQQQLVDRLGKLNREVLATREIPDERAVELLEAYQRLVMEISALIRRFERMIKEAEE